MVEQGLLVRLVQPVLLVLADHLEVQVCQVALEQLEELEPLEQREARDPSEIRAAQVEPGLMEKLELLDQLELKEAQDSLALLDLRERKVTLDHLVLWEPPE